MRLPGILLLLITSLLLTAQTDQALQFDGVDDFVSFENPSDFTVPPGTSFSLSAWICIDSFIEDQWIICKRDGGLPGFEFIVREKDKQLLVNLRNNFMADLPFQSNVFVEPGQWRFISLVIDNDEKTIYFYCNGNPTLKMSSPDIAAGFTGNTAMLLGTNELKSFFMHGRINELSLWNRSLKPEEIKQYMSNQLSGDEAGLLGYYSFDNQASDVTDNSQNNRNGIIHGASYIYDNNPALSEMKFISGTCLHRNTYPVGLNSVNQDILVLKLITEGGVSPLHLTRIKVRMNDCLESTSAVKVFSTGIIPFLSTDVQFGEIINYPTRRDLIFEGNQKLVEGTNYFWIACDIKPDALIGDTLDAECVSFVIEKERKKPLTTAPEGYREIIHNHSVVFRGGDDSVHTYRIPALEVTNKGTLIVACDARVNGVADLPNDINLVIKRSRDYGQTWMDTQVLVDCPGEEGAGDPCILVDRDTGTIWVFFIYSPYKVGLFESKPSLFGSNTIRMQAVKSDDDGETWSEVIELNDQTKNSSWQAALYGPGNGIQLSDGTLVVPGYFRTGNTFYSYILYSSDHGDHWQYSNSPGPETTECQVVESDSTTLILNLRNHYNNGLRASAQSSDMGKTWSEIIFHEDLPDPVCQAGFIRFTSKDKGFSRNRIIYSNPNSSDTRENMTIKMSYDEGGSFPVSKLINPNASAYSSLVIFPDYTIGILYETGRSHAYETMQFARFSLEWLSSGKDRIELQSNAITELNIRDINFAIYPNPAKFMITVRYDLPADLVISIETVDATGKVIEELVSDTCEKGMKVINVDIAGYDPGIYFCRLTALGENIERKFEVR